MRILVRNLDPGSGGGVSSFLKLLEAYCDRFPSDFLTVMCPRGSPMASLRRFDNVTVELLPPGPLREIHRFLWGVHGIRRQLARASYDVVWCVNVGAYVKTAVPQVLSILNAYQVYPWNVARLHPGSRARVALLRWFTRRSLRCADAVWVETGMMEQYVRAIPGSPTRVAVEPKAVVSLAGDAGQPLPPELAHALRRASGTLTALYVATLSPHKNHRLLAAMMEICRSRGIAARLVITLDEEQWSAVSPGAGSLIRSGHVIPAGWVPKEQLRPVYASADLCVMPSLLESLSSAHQEAMYWGRPQIVADLPYARDLCGDAALYADPHDPEPWVSALERLQSDATLRDLLVSRGAGRLADFPDTWTEMAERIRTVLAGAAASYEHGICPSFAEKNQA